MPYFKYHLPDWQVRQQEDRVNELRDACRMRGISYRLDGQEATVRNGNRPVFVGSIGDATRWVQSTGAQVEFLSGRQ